MDNNGKSRHSVWLSDEVWQEGDAFYKRCWRVRWVCSVTGWAGCYLSWRWSTT